MKALTKFVPRSPFSMAYLTAVIPLLTICIVPLHVVVARPSRTVPYFPHYNPWDLGDVGIHSEENRWNPFVFSDDSLPQISKYSSYSFDPSEKRFKDSSSIQESLPLSMPTYGKGNGGFVPPSFSALDKVYWWDKRFNSVDIPPSEDMTYIDGQDDYDTSVQGNVKKRDYTAAQLVNMLKALAKARRQRNIRIAGKGFRFGISR